MPPYDQDKARDLIDEALADHDAIPAFYALTGSHIYGFDSASSDIDLRGFHIAPAEEYAYLNSPREEITINMDGTTEGYEEYAELDFRSYSLKKFGSLLLKANHTTFELIFCGEPLMSPFESNMAALRETIERHLPLNTPDAYFGLGMNYYHSHGIQGDDPTSPKAYLYAYRAALGAQYTATYETIEADIHTIADGIESADTALIDALIEAKRAEQEEISQSLHERAEATISDELDNAKAATSGSGDKTAYRDDLDAWMRDLRMAASQR